MAEVKKMVASKVGTKSADVKEVRLTLSEDEAVAVKLVLSLVRGSSTYSARKHTYAVYKALDRAGIMTWPSAYAGLVNGVLRFRDGGIDAT